MQIKTLMAEEASQQKQNLNYLNADNVPTSHNCDKLKSERNKSESKIKCLKGLKCKVFQMQSLNYHEKQKVNITLWLKSKEQNCNLW